MNEHCIKLRTKNAKMMQMYGDKLTRSERLRSMRTNGLHTELQHSPRYGGISNSCTLSDGCGGGRFKMIGYSHPYRWSTLCIPVTAEQEARIFKKGCEMADVDEGAVWGKTQSRLTIGDCFYGPDHVKYDKGAAFFSYITKWNIWKPSKVNMICNRYDAELLLVEWPDLLDIKKEDGSITFSVNIDSSGLATDGWRVYPKKDPARLTPDQLHYMAEYYFRKDK